jgi:predicted RNA-binding protein with PUA-like domain
MYWLFKEEPDHYSYDDLVKDGTTAWEGVHNNFALKNLRQVKKGDHILYYHTGDQKAVVGIMKAVGDAYSVDGKTPVDSSKEIGVKVAPVKKLKGPVSLHEIKGNTKFKDFLLVKISRLSVMPVAKEQWDEILEMAKKAA